MKRCGQRIVRLLLIAAGAVFLTGCDRLLPEKNEAAADSAAGTEITWWTFPILAQEEAGDAIGTYEQKLIDAFEKENPDIRVKLEVLDYGTGPEKLENAFQTREACDVLLDAPGRIIAYGNEGRIVPLKDLFTEELLEDIHNPELIGACSSGTTPYMYPLSSAPFYMAFNRSMLEEAGVLKLVHEGWTTEEFDETLRGLRKAGFVPGAIFCNGTGGDQGTRALVANLYDGSVMNEDLTRYTLGEEPGMKALNYLKSCVDQGLLLNGTLLTGTDAIENFVYGRASFSILWGSSQQRNYQNLMDSFQVEAVEVPLPSEDGRAELEYLVNGFCIMKNKDADKIDAAKRFVRFACDDSIWGPKNVVQTGCIPVRHSFGALYEGEERMKRIETWTDAYIPYYNTVSGFSAMRGYWCQALRNLLNGYETPAGAMAYFMDEVNLETVKK